jgi:hypothetical protein
MTIALRSPLSLIVVLALALLMVAAFANVARGDSGPQFFGQTAAAASIAVGEATELAAGYTQPDGSTAFTVQTFQATQPGRYTVTVQLSDARPATYVIDVR